MIDLPGNQAAETAVVAALCLGHEEVFRQVGLSLEPADFQTPWLGFLWGAIARRYDDHRPWDAVLLASDLALGEVKAPPEEFGRLFEPTTADPGNATEYATLVYTSAMGRELVYLAAEQARNASTSADYRGVMALAQTMLDNLGQREAFREDGRARSVGARARAEVEKHVGVYRPIGFKTGLEFYDNYCDGLRAHRLHSIVAGPGTGKTKAAVWLSYHALEDGAVVEWHTREMSSEDIMILHASLMMEYDSLLLSRGRFQTPDDRSRFNDCMAWLEAKPLTIYQKTADALSIKRHLRMNGPDVGIVDYLQLVLGQAGDREYERLTGTVGTLMRVKQDQALCLLVLSQTAVERLDHKEGRVAQGKGTGALRESSDVLWELQRDAEAGDQALTWRLSKSKFGPVGKFETIFDYKIGKFSYQRVGY